MHTFLFSLIFSTVFVLLNFYIYKRLILKLDLKQHTKRLLNIFLVVNFFGVIGYLIARYYIGLPNWLYFLLSLPIGVLFLLFCTTIIYDISRVILSKFPMPLGRRKFLKKSLDVSSLVLAGSLSARALYEAKCVEIENVTIQIKNLQQPYTIVQLSDIHIGGLIDVEFIKDIVRKVNLLSPDLVVITGDLVDTNIAYAKDALEELKNLQSNYGTYFILGNHEYFHEIEKIITSVKSLGIRVLENENVYIGEDKKGFNLAGVYDVFGYRTKTYIPDLEKALLNKVENTPTVLLAHQPRYIYEVLNGVDLMLSGHTHGGQLYPFRFLVSILQPYIDGLHQHNERLQIYVNKGTGFWGPPMRLGASSEITKIQLKPEK